MPHALTIRLTKPARGSRCVKGVVNNDEGADLVRRRRRIAVVVVALTVVAVVAAVALIAGSRDDRGDTVQVRSSAPTSVVAPSTEPSEPPATAVASSSTTTAAAGTAGTGSPPGAAPTTSGPAWEVSRTSGLANLDPVTIHATGMPQAGYAVGQCPPGASPPDFKGCQLTGDPSVAYPVNGEFTSTVRVERWMLDGTVDCGRAPGTCVVGFMNTNSGSGFAPVSFPISFDPTRRPQITVTPDDALADGQSVVVSGVGVGEGAVQIEQCLLPAWASCTSLAVQSRADGTFSTPMTVRRTLTWGGHGAGSGTCGVGGTCVVHVWITPKGWNSLLWLNPDQPVVLNFAPVPATTTSTTTTIAPTTTSTTTVP